MKYCWAADCKESDREKTNVSFHSFPKDLHQRQLWIKATGRSCEPGKTAVICSKHFTVKDFECNSKNARLKRDVIPSRFNDAAANKQDEQQIKESQSLKGDPTSTTGMTGATVPIQPYDSDDSSPSENLSSPNENVTKGANLGSRKRIWRPAHLKQVTSEHLSSPWKRAKYWCKAMDEISVLKKKVKVLQEDKRRMAKKIKTLNDIMKHLKDKQLLDE